MNFGITDEQSLSVHLQASRVFIWVLPGITLNQCINRFLKKKKKQKKFHWNLKPFKKIHSQNLKCSASDNKKITKKKFEKNQKKQLHRMYMNIYTICTICISCIRAPNIPWNIYKQHSTIKTQWLRKEWMIWRYLSTMPSVPLVTMNVSVQCIGLSIDMSSHGFFFPF